MKTCIVTGTGAGIGRETAILLSKSGQFGHIAMIGRNMEALAKTKELMNVDVEVSIWEADFSVPECIPDIVEKIYENQGSIDCLLNIAGYTDPQPLLTTTLEKMRQTYDMFLNKFPALAKMISFEKYQAIFNPIKELYWDGVVSEYLQVILKLFYKQCDSVLKGATLFERFVKSLSIADFMNNMEGSV